MWQAMYAGSTYESLMDNSLSPKKFLPTLYFHAIPYFDGSNPSLVVNSGTAHTPIIWMEGGKEGTIA